MEQKKPIRLIPKYSNNCFVNVQHANLNSDQIIVILNYSDGCVVNLFICIILWYSSRGLRIVVFIFTLRLLSFIGSVENMWLIFTCGHVLAHYVGN